MPFARRAIRVAGAALCLSAAACSSLRELPRQEYAARAERRDVRVETRAGLRYDFDRVGVEPDSLIGYRRRDLEGRFEEYESVGLALDDVTRFSVRAVDWYRTTLVAGVALAAILAAALSGAGSEGGAAQPPCAPGPEPCR